MLVYKERMTQQGAVVDYKEVTNYTESIKKSGWLSSKDLRESKIKQSSDDENGLPVDPVDAVDTNGNGYNSIAEIKKALDEQGVSYKVRDNRNTLLALLDQDQDKVED